jgi:DME family drug/metabolite transporter
LAIGGIALLLVAYLRGALGKGMRWPKLETGLAAASMAAYQPLFFAGVARTGVAVGTVVAIGSAPILAGALGYIFRKEQPGPRWMWSTSLAIAGCALMLLPAGNVQVDDTGLLMALGAGASYATYAVASKRLLEDKPADAVVAVVFCLGALFLMPLLFTADLGWLFQPRGLGVALHLGLVATAAAYLLFARGLTLIPVASAVTFSLAEPLTAGILGGIVLGEQFTLAMSLGVVLVFSGLALLSINSRTMGAPAGPS